ncbi:hypothetical protein EVAR_60026_1 [Eumeta japonica]|uniref:Reverse transcriptase domain-containing protein n=1 Tax=Eumeta variegata TaxID=151549 RepID=A0A4C1ZGQ2_EUMVA|nr:hypothetical protein EVAR_60026_1 [Eumeta japonica]
MQYAVVRPVSRTGSAASTAKRPHTRILAELALHGPVLENIFRNLNRKGFGLNINGSRFNHLRFLDELVLFEEKPEILEQMVQSLNKKSSFRVVLKRWEEKPWKTVYKMGGRYQNDYWPKVETGNSGQTTVEIVGGGLCQEAH